MIDLLKRNKIILAVVGVLIAGFIWYGMTGGSAPVSDSALTAEAVSQSAEERAILDSLLQLRSIQLTGTIFSDQAFASLKDFRTEIVSEPVGRRNPFAPFEGEASSTSAIPRAIGEQDDAPARAPRTAPPGSRAR